MSKKGLVIFGQYFGIPGHTAWSAIWMEHLSHVKKRFHFPHFCLVSLLHTRTDLLF